MKTTMSALIITLLAAAATGQEAGPKITYDEHIRPIFRQHCLSCHNQDDAESDLALDNFSSVMEGGAGGEIVAGGDLGGSRLWALMNHDEEPYMPPEKDKIPAAELALVKQWIEGGLLENAGSKAIKKKSTNVAFTGGGGKPEGEPAMPSGLWKQPVVYTQRPAAVTAIAASPWAPLIAVAGQKQIVLYHSESGAMLGVLPFPEGIPHVLRFSRNGALLLAGGGRGADKGVAAVYDVKTGARLLSVGEEESSIDPHESSYLARQEPRPPVTSLTMIC